MGKVIGIDLGTTFSAIAHVNEHAQPEIVPNAEGDRITPSVIMFEDELVTVGKIAKQNASAVPEQIVEFVKREMGKSKEEFFREFDGRKYSAEELSAQILQKLKQDAEAHLNAEVTGAVVTVPAYFRDAEREATRNAGTIAGLNVLQVLNEPTAAALAYGLDQLGSDQYVFVFDLGGGTFDVTVMEVYGSKIEMIATNGDHRLGGKDWDDQIITYVAEVFEREHGENPLVDLHAYQDIQLNAIAAKESLSQRERARIVCNYNGNSSRVELTREKFEELTNSLVARCQALCDVVLQEAEMEWAAIDTVLLVGGSTRIPMVQEMIAKISGKEINPQEVNPDDVVALGAAIQGTLRQLEEVESGISKIATTESGISKIATTEDIPDAVIDRFIGPGGAPKITVVDGATHNLGIVLTDYGNFDKKREPPGWVEYNHVMIPKMTPIPCEIKETFYESPASETRVPVTQGLDQGQEEDDHIKFEHYTLGELIIKLPFSWRKLVWARPLDVTYKYNLDQTLEVTVEGPDGRTVNMVIQRSTLNEKEVAEATQRQEHLEVE